ncbi:hypothetical protein ACMFMF_008841 [Clarireedia jacksonii]
MPYKFRVRMYNKKYIIIVRLKIKFEDILFFGDFHIDHLEIRIGPVILYQIFDTLDALEAYIDQYSLAYSWGKIRIDSGPQTKPIDCRLEINYDFALYFKIAVNHLK